MKKLFLVGVEFEIVVVAEDHREAERLARRHAREEMSNDSYCTIVDAVNHVEQIPKPWMNSYPYGDETSKTVAELLATQMPESDVHAETQKPQK